MILLIDNYDSFTYNLAHLFQELGADVAVRRNDEIAPDEAEILSPSHLVVSPGPGRPEEAGTMPEILRRLSVRVPTFGVCLGHQALVQVFGGVVGPARELVHGKATTVTHDGRGIFAGLPSAFEAGRYHSLAATTVPDVFEVSATAPDGGTLISRRRRSSDPSRRRHTAATSCATSWRAMIRRARQAPRRRPRRRVAPCMTDAGDATPGQIGGFLVALR
jgi:anthranilate synthase/aminodeoxychorismate synthase-like glutamine amidotransferase